MIHAADSVPGLAECPYGASEVGNLSPHGHRTPGTILCRPWLLRVPAPAAWHGTVVAGAMMRRKCVSPAQRFVSGVRLGPDGGGSHARSRQHAISPQGVGVDGATRRGGTGDSVPACEPSTAGAGAGHLGIALSGGWVAECRAYGHRQLRQNYPRPARPAPRLISWWAGRDSNPHGSPHWILSPARLPVPPPALRKAVFAILRPPFLSQV